MSLEMGLPWALAWSLLLHSCLVPAAKSSNTVETIATARHVYIIWLKVDSKSLSSAARKLSATPLSGSEHLVLI